MNNVNNSLTPASSKRSHESMESRNKVNRTENDNASGASITAKDASGQEDEEVIENLNTNDTEPTTNSSPVESEGNEESAQEPVVENNLEDNIIDPITHFAGEGNKLLSPQPSPSRDIEVNRESNATWTTETSSEIVSPIAGCSRRDVQDQKPGPSRLYQQSQGQGSFFSLPSNSSSDDSGVQDSDCVLWTLGGRGIRDAEDIDFILLGLLDYSTISFVGPDSPGSLELEDIVMNSSDGNVITQFQLVPEVSEELYESRSEDED